MEANIGVMSGRIKNVVYPNRKGYAMTKEVVSKERREIQRLESEKEALVTAAKDCLVWVEAMARGGRPQAFAALDAMLAAIRKAEGTQ